MPRAIAKALASGDAAALTSVLEQCIPPPWPLEPYDALITAPAKRAKVTGPRVMGDFVARAK